MANLVPGDRCPVCSVKVKALFTGTYCPGEDAGDHKRLDEINKRIAEMQEIMAQPVVWASHKSRWPSP